jgi:hypothetical protein
MASNTTKNFHDWKELVDGADGIPWLSAIKDEKTLATLMGHFSDIPANALELYRESQKSEASESTASEKATTEKKSGGHSTIGEGYIYGDTEELMVKADGTKATNLEEDRRYALFVEWRKTSWKIAHPNATDKDREAYFSTTITDPQDPIDKLCPISRSRSKMDEDIYMTMSVLTPETIKKYQANEKTRIYADANDDPAYRSALLIAKGKTRELYEKSKEAGKELTSEELTKAFLIEQVKSLGTFAKNNPEKTAAYINKGEESLALAASVLEEPTPEEINRFSGALERKKEASAKKEKDALKKEYIKGKASLDPKYKETEEVLQKELTDKHAQIEAAVIAERKNELTEKYKGKTDPAGVPLTDAQIGKQVAREMQTFEHGERGERGLIKLTGFAAETEIDDVVRERFKKETGGKEWLPAYHDNREQGGPVPAHAKLNDDEVIARYEETLKQDDPAGFAEYLTLKNMTDEEFDTVMLAEAESESEEAEAMDEGGSEPDSEPEQPENNAAPAAPIPAAPAAPAPEAPSESEQPDAGATKLPPRRQPISQMPRQENNQPANQANDALKTIRKINNMKSGGMGGAGQIGGLAGEAAEAAETVATVVEAAPSAVPIVIGIVILLIIIIVVVVFMLLFGGGGGSSEGEVPTDIPPITINKIGPSDAQNGQDLLYSITVSFPGSADDVLVRDPLPAGAEIVQASGIYTTEDTATGKAIVWSMRENMSGGGGGLNGAPAPSAINVVTYTEAPYNLPPPQAGATANFTPDEISKLNALGSKVARYQGYLLTKNSDAKKVDPFLSVIWSGAIEGTRGNNYSWNCKDNASITINDGCQGGFASGKWQVGYGVQVSQAINHIVSDFSAAYGPNSAEDAGKVQTVGQSVIANSGGKITNPATFPVTKLSDLVSKAQGGNEQAQQAIAILLMDPDLGAISVALEVAGDIQRNNDWAATMRGWGSYYRTNLQNLTFSNRMQAIADKYTGASGGIFGSQTFTVQIKPNVNDAYVTNQASAEVIGARAGGGTPAQLNITDENAKPKKDENCGSYDLSLNPLNMNFGDPTCSLSTPDDRNKLFDILKQVDGDANAHIWFDTIAPCEAPGYDPNYYFTDAGVGHWGLFGMGASINGAGTDGNGPNGTYDRGDVQWIKQAKNAIAYNKDLTSRGQAWQQWSQCYTPSAPATP